MVAGRIPKVVRVGGQRARHYKSRAGEGGGKHAVKAEQQSRILGVFGNSATVSKTSSLRPVRSLLGNVVYLRGKGPCVYPVR